MSSQLYQYRGQRRTPRFAVRDFCRWCNGGSPKDCPSSSCPLFPYRLPKPMPEAQESPLRAIHRFCLGCAGSAHDVQACTAHKPYLEQPACSLWPHRAGKRHVSAQYRAERREQAKKQRDEAGPAPGFVSRQLALYRMEG